MADDLRGEVTRILEKLREQPDDGREATDRLFRILYGELHSLAECLMHSERPRHILQPTALVNEAYLKLLGAHGTWHDRAHFMRTAARAMRQVLVDYARKRMAAKRGGDKPHITLDEEIVGANQVDVAILELSDTLGKLFEMDPRMGRVVEMRVFAGMKMREIAEVLAVSKTTVDSDWRFARTWLSRELGKDGR